jgi:hypothetical protein
MAIINVHTHAYTREYLELLRSRGRMKPGQRHAIREGNAGRLFEV